MKLIQAVISPAMLDEVKVALGAVGVHRLTVSDAEGFGRDPLRARSGEVERVPRVRLEIAVNEPFLDPAVQAILSAVRKSDEPGNSDGKIFISPLLDCVHIRTGERGPEAI